MQARLTPAPYGTEGRHSLGRHALQVDKASAEIGPQRAQPRYSSPFEAILNDKTLRAGDTVITGMGALVFRGADRLPYTADDFTDFRESRFLTKKERTLIDADLGLTGRALAIQSFKSMARAPQATPAMAKAGGMRSFFPVPQTVR